MSAQDSYTSLSVILFSALHLFHLSWLSTWDLLFGFGIFGWLLILHFSFLTGWCQVSPSHHCPYFCPSNWHVSILYFWESQERNAMLNDCILKSQMLLRRIEGEKTGGFSFVFLRSTNKATVVFETVVVLVLGKHVKVYRFLVLWKRILSFKLVNVVNDKFHMTLRSA